MALTLSYFAWVRERMGVADEAVALPEDVRTVANSFRPVTVSTG
jgi:molybdopterin synthase sulfur carrier subunit